MMKVSLKSIIEPFDSNTELNSIASFCFSIKFLLVIITKFPYNTCSDWLKQRALSENRVRVDDGKLASKFLLRNFDEFDPN